MSTIDTTDTKPWWTSTTIQGAAVSALGMIEPLLVKYAHIDLGDPGKIVAVAFDVIGVVMVIIGRTKATKALV